MKISNTRFAILLLPFFFLFAGALSGQQIAPPALRTVASVRTVTSTDTAAPVRLRGIVTAFSGWKKSFFLQDRTDAISVNRLETTQVSVGDEVEITGHAQAGLFANILISDQVTILRHAGLPPALPFTYRELRTGNFDSHFVEVKGIIHAVRKRKVWERDMLTLELQTDEGSIPVYLAANSTGDFQYLVDSQVLVKGVCGTIFNDRRQLMGLRLFVDAISQIQVLAPAYNPANLPLSPLDSLLTFHGPALDHRVRIQGTVTYQASGNQVFLQQGRSAIRVISQVPGVWPLNSRAEAIGFVLGSSYLPYLENASIQAVGQNSPPVPIKIKASDVIDVDNGFVQAPFDGLLVQLDGEIIDRLPNTGRLLWALKSGDIRFEAELPTATRSWAFGFESGTHVRLTGICIAEADKNKALSSFHILLRSQEDMVATHQPYWNQSLLMLLGTYSAILFGSLLIYLFQRLHLHHFALGMTDEFDPDIVKNCRRVATPLTIFSMVVSLGITLAAPDRSSHFIVDVLGIPPAGVLVGSALFLDGIWVLLHLRHPGRAFQRLKSFLCLALLLTGIGGMSQGAGIWQLSPWMKLPLSIALCLILISCSGLALPSRRWAGFGQVLLIIAAFTALLKLVGVIYGADVTNGLAAHLFMSLPTGVAMLSLSIASLLASSEVGLMKAVSSPRLGGFVLRRLIPAVVLSPITIGYIRLQLQIMGLFDTRFGLSLFALSNALSFCLLMWISATVLNRMDRMRSKTEEKLREREHKLELIFETGSMGDWSWNVEPDALCAHASVWKLYGEPVREGPEPASWFRSRQHPDDLAFIDRELQTAIANQQVLDIEFRVIWPDSSIHWLYCRAVPTFDAGGKLVQINGINLDITERKATEERLIKSEVLFRKLQDAMPQIVWTANPDGQVVYYNRRWYDYTGLSEGALWGEIVPAEHLASVTHRWLSATETGLPYENEVLFKRASDGAYRWHLVRGVPIHNTQGKVEQWFGTCTDIDDFKRAREELYALNQNLERQVELRSMQLAQSERKYRLMIDSVKDYAIFMLDATGKVETWNGGAERVSGYKASEIVGEHYSILFETKDRMEGEPERCLSIAEARGHLEVEARRVRKDGTTFWANILISAVFANDGQLRGFSKIVRDITERRRTEQLLVAAQKRAEEANLAKSSFLASMSHEIRTPMNAILGMADLLWDTVLDRDQREYVGRFRRAGANLLSLINDILDLSKIESGRFDLETVDFDLLELIERVMELASTSATIKGVAFNTELVPATPAFLIGDPVRLQQVLNNLISNAIKFTPSGSVLLRISLHPDGKPGHLEFAVTDTGIGIPVEKLGAIFEDFTQAESSTTRRFGGTGLGLGICRRLVDKMSGVLSVDSTFGKGSTFRFDAQFGVSALAADNTPKHFVDLVGETVLVVDDNATNRIIISEMCSALGMKVRAAASATEALLMLAEAKTLNRKFALILLDRVLPDSKGFDALRAIKSIARDVPVIISSSDNQSGDLTESKALGAAGYLMKPVRRTELRACIFEALASAGASKDSEKSWLEQKPKSKPSLNILLAEDSEDNRFLVQAYLAGKEHQLTFVEDGQKAVEAFTVGDFDLILMDIQMPILDGHSATRRIRAIEREHSLKATVIIALTANALVEDTQRSFEAGCNAHLAKPISKDKLIAALDGYQTLVPITMPSKDAVEVAGPEYVIEIPPGFESASRRYLKKCFDQLPVIQGNFAEGSFDQLRSIGHKLKGTGLSYGFADLTALGAAIEESAKSFDVPQMRAHIHSLERYMKYAVESLLAEK